MLRMILVFMVLAFTFDAFGADDPSIKGEKRASITKAMVEHIEQNTVDGRYILYDAVDDKLLKLKLDGLHEGIVQKSDYYVSCADFVSSTGTIYDLDFLVVEEEGKFKALQGVVHKVGKDENGWLKSGKRKYHLETTSDSVSDKPAAAEEKESGGFFDRLFGN